MKTLLSCFCLLPLVLCAGWLARAAIRANSPTIDEIAYLRAGYDVFKRGDFSGTVNGGVGPLPILLAYWPLAFDRTVQPEDLAPTNPRAVELVVLAAAAVALLFFLCRAVSGARPLEPVPLAAGITGAVFVLAFAASGKQFGLRYVLLLYPLAILLAVHGATRAVASPAGRRVLAGLGLLLAGLQVGSAYSSLPHPLAYFNPLAGGPDRGIRYLDDSNLDWGQGLAALAEYRSTDGRDAALGLVYFGSIDPRAYGIEVVPLETLRAVPSPRSPRRRLLGISVTHLCRETRLEGFRAVRPRATVAHSILIYDLADPEAAEALEHCLAEAP